MIESVSEPVWLPNKRQWQIVYTVKDSEIGKYQQRVWCEAFISAERVVKHIKERIENDLCNKI